MLAEIAAEQIQWLWAFLLTSWLPIALSLAAVALRLRPRPSPALPSAPTSALGSAEALSALTWLFLYAEHLSPSRIPLFDYGAPALALISLVALPILGFRSVRHWRELVDSRGAWPLLGVSSPLVVLSLVPGVFLVWFYAALLHSDR